MLSQSSSVWHGTTIYSGDSVAARGETRWSAEPSDHHGGCGYDARVAKDWFTRIPVDFGRMSGTSVDLGCGRFPRNPLTAQTVVGVDIVEVAQFEQSLALTYRRTGVGEALPLDDVSANACTAFDFLEHLPRWDRDASGVVRNLFIEMMNEVHRILVPGGLFIAVTPCFPNASAFVDPTHVNTNTPTTHEYFSGPAHARALEYGFNGRFETVAGGWVSGEGPLWQTDEPARRKDAVGPIPAVDAIPLSVRLRRRAARTVEAARPRRPSHFLWVLRKP